MHNTYSIHTTVISEYRIQYTNLDVLFQSLRYKILLVVTDHIEDHSGSECSVGNVIVSFSDSEGDSVLPPSAVVRGADDRSLTAADDG